MSLLHFFIVTPLSRKDVNTMLGAAFYDDDTLFVTYIAHRQQADNPPDALERPVFLDLVGSLVGLRILELGCGDAAFGRFALEQGCQSYLGVEASGHMIAAAQQTLANSNGKVIHMTIEAWNYPQAAFDLVVSRLALHYVADFRAVCANVSQALAAHGRFVFSIEHPILTCCARNWQTSPGGQDWIVDTYFETGLRKTAWLGGEVIRYHRTIEEYYGMLQQTGFVVEWLRESRPRREWFADQAHYEQHTRVPLFLFFAARKG
jgi:SAM-dependent methyltransferase